MRVVEYALFVVAFAVAGLVILALLWSGEQPYRDLARDNGIDRYVFVLPNGGRHEFDLNTAVSLHGEWARYVTGGLSEPPGGAGEPPRRDPPEFTADEYAHMADVRTVFDGAKFLVPLALVVIIVRLQRSRARSVRDMWSLVRTGSLVAAGAVALVGVVATVAFDPLFLAFHYVFFPQGNFLFGPDSNLIRLYPDWYWQGITLRIGASFIAFSLAVAALAHLRLTRLLP